MQGERSESHGHALRHGPNFFYLEVLDTCSELLAPPLWV